MRKTSLWSGMMLTAFILMAGTALSAQLTLSSDMQGDQLTIGTGDTLAVGTHTLTNNGATDIDGTLTVSKGTVDADGDFDATGGSLTFSDAGALELGGKVTGLGTFSAATSTVTYNQAGNQDVTGVTYYNLTASVSGTKALDEGTTIENTLTTDAGTTLALGSSTLNIGSANPGIGSWTHNGDFDAGTGTVVYQEDDDQSVVGVTYYDLTIDGGNIKSLGGAVDVGHTLTLTSGLVSLGANNLILGSSATVSGGSSTAMVITGGTGLLRKMFSGTNSGAPFTFPVGDNTGTAEYSPATLEFTSGIFNSGWAEIKVTDAKQPQNTSATDYLTRYWTVNSGGITDFSCNTSFTYPDADIEGTEASIRAGQYSDSAWTVGNAVDAANNNFAMTVTGFSDFTGVQQATTPTTQASEITFSSVTENSMTVGWIRGNGPKVLVLAHEGSAVDSDPVDGTVYTANAAFGSGSKIGTANYVVYQGTGASVSVTGLTASTTYHFRAYELDDTGVPVKYNTATAANNPNSQKTDGATKIVMTGPATVLRDGLGVFTLTAMNSANVVKNVNQDTVFSLSDNSAGTGTFYSDAAGTTILDPAEVTINSGQSTATFYYRDDTFGTPTLTATQTGGMSLTAGNKQIRVSGNNALHFDGTDDYVLFDSTASPYSGTLTIEAWIRSTSIDNEKDIVAWGGNASDGNVLEFRMQGGKLQFGIDAGGWSDLLGSTSINTGVWVHVCVTKSGTDVKLYVNGVEDTSGTIDKSPTFDRMCIASLYKDEAMDRYFPGEIDEVRIWNTVRTSAEIRANMHHELQGNEANLVAYYKLDTGTGTTADDSSNGGYNGTLTNGPAWQTSGAMSGPGNALDFDVTNNAYVDCGNVGTGVKTVEFWVKPTSNTDHFLDLDNGTHYVQAVAGTVTAVNFASPTVYVNGVADGTLETARWNHVAVTTETGISASALTLAKVAGNYLTGQMEEVRVWNTVRTAAQIRDNMCKSMQGDETGLVAYYRMDQQDGTTLYDISPFGHDGTLNNMADGDWVASTAFNTWIGSDSTAWATTRNWSRSAAPVATDNVGVPDYSNNTGYPAGNAPTISGGPTANHFVLATDAGSTLSSDLTVNGNLLLNADFDAGAKTVTVAGTTVNTGDLSIAAGTMDCNGDYDASSGSTTFTGAGILSLFGTYDLGTFTKSTGTIRLNGTSAQTIVGTLNPYNLTIANSVSVDASGATSLTVDNQLAVNDGTFTSASDYHHVSIASGATLALSGDITVSGNWDNDGTFTHNDHKVTLDGGDQQVLGDTTFYDLSKTVAATLTFEAGKTTTVANALTLQGAAGQLLSLRSGTDGTQWKIDPQGTRNIAYLDVKDSNNIDAANMGAEDHDCVDSGNNTNWFNTSAPTATAATSITESGFTANWDSVADVTDYRLDVSTKSDFSSYVTNYQDKDVGNVTASAVTGLSETTVYYYRVRAEKDGAASDNSNTISVTTSDGTGVTADVQDAAPNNGDGNGDGTKDSLQTSVASLPSATPGQRYLTVAVRDGCGQLNNVAASTYASVGTADPGYTYPYEMVAFTIPCASGTVRIYYHGADSLADLVYRKFGPTPSDWNNSVWYSMPGVTFGTKEIGGKTVPYVEFSLTESQLGDDTNGFPIVDQGGVAQATAIPTLNEWGMILLAILLGIGAFRCMRRRV